MKIFDNSGIFGNASTIAAESVSAEIARIVESRDCRRFAGIARIVEKFHILAIILEILVIDWVLSSGFIPFNLIKK